MCAMSNIKYHPVGEEPRKSKRKLSKTFKRIAICCILLMGTIFFMLPGRTKYQQHPSTTLSIYDTTDIKPKFYVNTPECHMPYVDPFTPDALQIFTPVNYRNCSKHPDLVTSEFDKRRRRYTLLLHGNESTVQCSYREILRAGEGSEADNNFMLLASKNLHQNFLVPEEIEAMIVQCQDGQTKTLLQKLAFSFIQYKPSNKPAVNAGTPPKRRPSVLLIGIDSLSRINFRRNMPYMLKYLNDNHWFELEGYNKIEDNTFPNLMAVLTGHTESKVNKLCNPQTVSGLHRCIFSWDNYKAEGYRTAYAEDWAGGMTFNMWKKGFVKPPTDYYLRPFVIAIETLLQENYIDDMPLCLGQQRYAEYIYDYAVQLTEFYANETEPVFGLFWTSSFSHSNFALPSSMDEKMLEYFRTLEQNGVMERAVVVFFSDHGVRFGELRQLPSGFLDERLPMFFISLPKWFQAAHPDFVAALNVNKNRLTSHFDFHMTLNHILELGNPELILPQASACAKCQSIFREVPVERTCSDAGIPEEYCTCGSFKSLWVWNNKLVHRITVMIIEEMNAYLKAKQLDEICAVLTLKSIKEAAHKLVLTTIHHWLYRIKFETDPRRSSFEAIASYDARTKSLSLNVETISRINAYELDSHCLADKQARKYCICKDASARNKSSQLMVNTTKFTSST